MTEQEHKELEDLKDRLRYLESRNKFLERQALEDSFRINPDISGGAFTQDEIDRAKDWR